MTIKKIKKNPRTKRDPNKRKGRMIHGFEAHEAIEAIQGWAIQDGNEGFDCAFVNTLQEALEKYECLTERQESALENIITRWKIDLTEEY